MDFEHEFFSWLRDSITQSIPDTAQAFCFNLYEPVGKDGVTFGIELVGAGQFDEDNSDWACDEVWTPDPRGISIPAEYTGRNWQGCLAKMKVLVTNTLATNSPTIQKLKSARGIGIGFVDGDLEVIWKSQLAT